METAKTPSPKITHEPPPPARKPGFITPLLFLGKGEG